MILDRLQDVCKEKGLIPDGDIPLQISPGVYLFYATPISLNCRKYGQCKHQRYYMIELGSHLTITQ